MDPLGKLKPVNTGSHRLLAPKHYLAEACKIRQSDSWNLHITENSLQVIEDSVVYTYIVISHRL